MMGEEKRSRADRMSTRFWKLHGRKGWNVAAAGEATDVHLAVGPGTDTSPGKTSEQGVNLKQRCGRTFDQNG